MKIIFGTPLSIIIESIYESEFHLDTTEFATRAIGDVDEGLIVYVHVVETFHILIDEILHT